MPLWTPPDLPTKHELTAIAGVTLTGGALDVKGVWAALITASARDCYGIWLKANGLHITATATPGLVDIGYGPTAGDVIVVPDWNVGYCTTLSSAGALMTKMQYFPCFIPAGSKVWARFAGLSADTVIIDACLSEDFPVGGVNDAWVAYGKAGSGSKGANVTPGAGSWGTAVQLTASTTEDHRRWAVGLGGAADATLLNHGNFMVRLAVDSSGTDWFGQWQFCTNSTTEAIGGPFPPYPIYRQVPAGSGIWAQMNADVTTDLFDVIAYAL
jgi:hypothetical protein